MTQADITQTLMQLTGALTPTGGATASDLEQARMALAQTLLHGIAAAQLISESQPAARTSQIRAAVFDESIRSHVRQLVDSALAAQGAGKAPTELAYLTSLSPATTSAPAWAAGMQVTRTLGPFEDSSAIPYWLHVFNITRSVQLAYGNAANVFGVFPVKTGIASPPGPHTHLDLGQGSIWFRAAWFATGAPADSFTGFRIQSGALDFSAGVSLVSGVVILPAGATFKLTAQLAPNPAPLAANGPGADANHAAVQTPVNLQMDFAQNSAKIDTVDDSSLTAYASTVRLHWNNQKPAFVSGQIAIACAPDVASFAFSKVRSTLFRISGSADIAAGGWALPAPQTTAANLGDADGAGYLYLGLKTGISAQWQTHDPSVTFDGVILEAAPGKLSIIASSSGARSFTSSLQLWNEDPASVGRRSSIEFIYPQPTSIVYLATSTTELLYAAGTLNASLDRPLEADGSRLPLLGMNAAILVFAEATQTRVFLIAIPNAKASIYSKEFSIAVKNSLLGVQPPTLVFIGKLQATPETVVQCRVGLFFHTYWLLPTLPDPYAANFDSVEMIRSQQGSNSFEVLLVQIQWNGAATQPQIQLAVTVGSQTNSGLANLANAGAIREGGGLVLLDLSSRADLFGVKIGLDLGQRENQVPAGAAANAPVFGFSGLSLAFNQGLLATFALPQTSWEPMFSEELPPNTLISAGIDAADGGPLVLHSVNFQQLVPVAPIPVLTSQINNVVAGLPFQATFSLPFGLIAQIDQPNQLVKTRFGLQPQLFVNLGDFALNRPDFSDHDLRGGHQLTLIAPSNSNPPSRDQPNSAFAGTTHVFPFPPGGAPGNPTGYGYSVLDASVGGLFEGEFGGGGGVPLRRIDFSGYGASIFSDWRDAGLPPRIIQVQFNTITGRTGYEVVKAVSILYPYCVRIVRTVTIKRKLAGWVDRKDTGWQAAGPGEFGFLTADFAGHVHPGGVLGVYNVRNIRELDGAGNVVSVGPLPPVAAPFLFRKVLFDAEIGIDSRLAVAAGGTLSSFLVGGKGITLVPSRDLVGYVQLSPVFDPANPAADYSAHPAHIAGLLARTGPLTPDLPCVMAVASLGARPGIGLRCTSIEVNMATAGANSPAVAVAVRGAPQLPRDGAWSVGKRGVKEPAPHLLPPNASIPLVQNAADTAAWYFADATDVLQLNSPDNFYSFLQSTGTQKVLFERPTVPQAGVTSGGGGQAPGIQLPAPPSFGDMGALLNATGLFPDIANALSLNTGGVDQIENLASGLKYKKIFTYPPDPATATGAKQLTLANLLGVFSIDLAYADTSKGTTKPTVITLTIDPTASPRWSISVTPLSMLITIASISSDPLLTIIAGYSTDANYVDGFVGDENTKPHVTNLNVQFSAALSVIQTVFSRIQAIASLLPGGKAAGLKIALSDGKLTVEDNFSLPTIPLGLGELSDISLDLGLSVQLSPLSAAFNVGVGSPDHPFNWIVSPLSGNGLVELGLKNNKPNLDLQAGLGLALAIDLAIASGSASVVIALNIDVNPPAVTLMVLLTGQASVDVLDGLASASLTLTAGIGATIDPLPVPPNVQVKVLPPEIDFPPETITMLATVSVGIHLTVCWVASVDWDGSWQFSQAFTTPAVDVSL